MAERFSIPLPDAASHVLQRLQADDRAQREANLPRDQRTRNIDVNTGAFLWQMAIASRPKAVLEIGSSNGISTIWLASAAKLIGAHVLGTEIIPERAEANNRNLAEAGVANVARVLAGDARELDDIKQGQWDFVFLDAEKEDYLSHLQTIEPYLAPGALILTDNVISHDCRDLQEYLRSADQFSTATVPLDRGIEMSIYRPADSPVPQSMSS